MLGSDSTDDFGSFLTRLHTAYGNARFAAEARRNLPAHLQDRLLRYRRVA